MDVPFTVRIFKEQSTFVAHAPELDISTCGDTEEQAKRNIQDAVRGFLEVAGEHANEILEECGYRLEDGRWKEPDIIGEERMTVAV